MRKLDLKKKTFLEMNSSFLENIPDDEFTSFLLGRTCLYYGPIFHCKQGRNWDVHCPWSCLGDDHNSLNHSFLPHFPVTWRKVTNSAAALSSPQNTSPPLWGAGPHSTGSLITNSQGMKEQNWGEILWASKDTQMICNLVCCQGIQVRCV